MAKRITHQDIIDRIELSEEINQWMAGVFLLYSIAIAFLIASFALKDFFYVILGIICYITGIVITIYVRKMKK